MPSLELNKLQPITGPRALSDTDRASVEPGAGATGAPRDVGGIDGAGSGAHGANAGISIEVGSTLNTSAPPVNNDRVSEIRSALRDGTYPLIPTEISDAMIAAQMSFEIER